MRLQFVNFGSLECKDNEKYSLVCVHPDIGHTNWRLSIVRDI